MAPKYETLDYPVIFHQEGNVWGYSSPDFGGGGASSYNEALELAQDLLIEALDLHAEMGKEFPKPTNVADIDANGGLVKWFPVTVAISTNPAEKSTPISPA